MKGDANLLEKLNDLLSDELTAINQYMVHSSMCEDWGYSKLHEAVEKRAIDEMKHAEMLIERVLFMEGIPIVTNLKKIHIGADVKKQLENDQKSEEEAIDQYNEVIRLAADLKDNGTRDLLQNILNDEEKHLDWLDTQLELINQIGLPGYLVEQL